MVEHAVRDVHDCYGRLDILVNCAGISEPGEIASVSPESWSRVIGVNLTGTMMCCRACFPIMKAAGFGRIVNIASVMALRGTLFGTNASYTASKAGVIGLTKELAVQGADFGVHVNAISPGITATEMLNALAEEQKAKLASFVLLKRLASPTEIAYGILFLVSRLSSYVTGEVLNPNGGLGLGIGALKGQ
jgi:3-oxoacyl-[acyl-carrier protein] reductase